MPKRNCEKLPIFGRRLQFLNFLAMARPDRGQLLQMALVRVVVTVENGDAQRATDEAVKFVQTSYEPLRSYLPAQSK